VSNFWTNNFGWYTHSLNQGSTSYLDPSSIVGKPLDICSRASSHSTMLSAGRFILNSQSNRTKQSLTVGLTNLQSYSLSFTYFVMFTYIQANTSSRSYGTRPICKFNTSSCTIEWGKVLTVWNKAFESALNESRVSASITYYCRRASIDSNRFSTSSWSREYFSWLQGVFEIMNRLSTGTNYEMISYLGKLFYFCLSM